MTTQTVAMKLAVEALEYASTGNRRPELIGPAIAALNEHIVGTKKLAELATEMNNSEKFKHPEAIRLLNFFNYHGFFDTDWKAAHELRRLHQEVEGLSSECIRLQNLVKDLSDWNDTLKQRLSNKPLTDDQM